MAVFTDVPEELARVALAHLGAARRIEMLESGSGAEERAVAKLGAGAAVVRTREELLAGNMTPMEHKDVADRQLDALLERLDRIGDELHSGNLVGWQHG